VTLLAGSQLRPCRPNRRRRPTATHPESGRPHSCLDEPISPLVLSHFQLACRSQRHPCPQAQRPVRIPAPQTALLSNAVVVSGPCNWPPPLFPPCLWLCVPGVTFFICSSEPLHLAHAARPDDAAFSLLALVAQSQSVRSHAGPPGKSDRQEAAGEVAIEAVRWGSIVSTHRQVTSVRGSLTMRHFRHGPRRTPHLLTGLCPSGVSDDLAWRSAQTRGK